MSKSTRPHWYFIIHGECPVCGHSTTYRERRYTERPKAYRRRHAWLTDAEAYDHCIG